MLIYEFGDFGLDVRRRLLLSRADGEPVPLSAAAFDALRVLVERAGTVVDKATLMDAVWPGVHVEDNNLAQSISTIRQALGERPGDHRFIVTVPGLGYQFVGQVTQATGHPSSPEAYQAYLVGWSALMRPNAESLEVGLQSLHDAIALDPRFALAYTRLAHCYMLFNIFGIRPADEVMPKAHAAAETALALDSALAEAHALFGHIRGLYYRDWESADRGLRRALDINPRLAVAHHFQGLWLLANGEIDEALAAVRQAQALEPLGVIFSANIGMILYYGRRYQEAIAQLEATLAMDAGVDHARSFLGRTYLRLGQIDCAIDEFERRRGTTMGSVADLAVAHALAGRRHEALAGLQYLIDALRDRHVSAYDIATVYAALGDWQNALDALERAAEFPCVNLDPAFDALRAEPGFQQLMSRLFGSGIPIRRSRSR